MCVRGFPLSSMPFLFSGCAWRASAILTQPGEAAAAMSLERIVLRAFGESLSIST